LSVVLGADFVERLTRKVTHLICNFAKGDKYVRASKWGIISVTPDWLYECVRQVGLQGFYIFEIVSLTWDL